MIDEPDHDELEDDEMRCSCGSKRRLTKNERAILEDRKQYLPLPVTDWNEDVSVQNKNKKNPYADRFDYRDVTPPSDRSDYLPLPVTNWNE